MMNPLYPTGLSQPDEQNRTRWVDATIARVVMCADCDDSTAQTTFGRLPPQARYPSTVPFPLPEFPTVSCTSVICTEDQFVCPDWSRRVTREQLGSEPHRDFWESFTVPVATEEPCGSSATRGRKGLAHNRLTPTCSHGSAAFLLDMAEARVGGDAAWPVRNRRGHVLHE
jgi:hypothetical protein